MSYDLCLGFREKPQDLDSILASQGIRLSFITDLFRIQVRYYTHEYDGVDFAYYAGIFRTNLWEEQYGIQDLWAQGVLSIAASNERGQQRQEQIGKFLRDHYKAVLENPQIGELVTD